MSLNRQLRRQQERQAMRDWVRMDDRQRAVQLAKNGITKEYADSEYNRGHVAGFENGSHRTLMVVYAACVLELLDAGNSRDEALSFLKAVDNRVLTSIDAEEDITEVFNRTGVHFEFKDKFDRVREVEQ